MLKKWTKILPYCVVLWFTKKFNADFDSESKDSTPQGEICLVCGGSGQIDNSDLGGIGYRPCSNCDGQGKLSHNQYLYPIKLGLNKNKEVI